MGGRKCSLPVAAATTLVLLVVVSGGVCSDNDAVSSTAGMLAADHPLTAFRGERNLLSRDTMEPHTNPADMEWRHSSIHTCSTQYVCEKLFFDKVASAIKDSLLQARMTAAMSVSGGTIGYATNDDEDVAVMTTTFDGDLRDQPSSVVTAYLNEKYAVDLQKAGRDGVPFDFFENALSSHVHLDTFCSVACHAANCRSREGASAGGSDRVFHRCRDIVCPDVFNKMLHFYREIDTAINDGIVASKETPDRIGELEEHVSSEIVRVTGIVNQICYGYDHVSLRTKNSRPEYEPEGFVGKDDAPEELKEIECSIPHMEYLMGNFFVEKKKSGLPIEVGRIHAEMSRTENYFCETLCDQNMNCRETAALADCKSGCFQRMLMILNMEAMRPKMLHLDKTRAEIVENNKKNRVPVEYERELPSRDDPSVAALATLRTENEEQPDVERRCQPVHLVHTLLFELVRYWEDGVGISTTNAKEMCSEICRVQLHCNQAIHVVKDPFYDPSVDKMHAGTSESHECERGCLARASLMTGQKVNIFSISWDYLSPLHMVLPEKRLQAMAAKFGDALSRGLRAFRGRWSRAP